MLNKLQLAELMSRQKEITLEIDMLVLGTPTGETRNKLTEASIFGNQALHVLDELYHSDN